MGKYKDLEFDNFEEFSKESIYEENGSYTAYLTNRDTVLVEAFDVCNKPITLEMEVEEYEECSDADIDFMLMSRWTYLDLLNYTDFGDD